MKALDRFGQAIQLNYYWLSRLSDPCVLSGKQQVEVLFL
jgi:hypothetical protein